MKRRTYLASLAALVSTAGCTESGATRANPQGEDGSSLNSPSDGRKIVSVKSAQATEGTTLSVSVSVRREMISPDQTARIALEYENTGREPVTLNVNPDTPDPLHSIPTHETPALYLISDAYSPTRASDSCWKATESLPVPAAVWKHELKAGKSVQLEYDVWASPQQSADCIQPGTYEFDPPKGTFTLAIAE